jgi:hypothetical protein
MNNIININQLIKNGLLFYYSACRQDGTGRYDNFMIDGYDIYNAACKAENQCNQHGLRFIEVRPYQTKEKEIVTV